MAVDDALMVNEGAPAMSLNVVSNDLKGPANESTQILSVCSSPGSVNDPPGGTAVRQDATRIRYTPDPGFDGVDSFEYTVCDSGFPVGRDTATVTVTVARAISATVETAPVPHAGDAADDSAVWVHPADPSKSTIIGTDKLGGVAVYDLAGTQLQYLPDGRMNNVDLRQDITVGDWSGTLVAVSNRTAPFRVSFYRVDPATGLLEAGGAGSFSVPFEPYGLCLYRSPTSGDVSVFVTEDNSLTGHVEQWTVADSAMPGQVQASLARSIEVGSLVEGCVADDDLGRLYLAEEDVGIWRYDPEPDAGTDRVAVDRVFPMGHLDDDVEGLAIARQAGGGGHLVASSQGDDAYTVYGRDGANDFERAVRITPTTDGLIDGTEDTDGIEVSTANLGSAFPSGVFVAQDGTNQTPTTVAANQNFKLVPLQLLLDP
jgi:myo-inositol-hexaphosphate 3-phosphohydrolase